MSNLKNKTQAVRNFLSKVTELKCCKNLDYMVDCCGNNRVAFIVANPYYESYRLKLGDPCCNDANLIAEFYRDHGYKCFGIIDPTKEEFLMYLNHFTSRSDIHDLIVYYAGHGGSIPDHPAGACTSELFRFSIRDAHHGL